MISILLSVQMSLMIDFKAKVWSHTGDNGKGPPIIVSQYVFQKNNINAI